MSEFSRVGETESIRIASLTTAVEICKALGLDPRTTQSIVIEVLPGHLPTVTVRQHVGAEGDFTTVLRKFKLTQISPAEDPTTS